MADSSGGKPYVLIGQKYADILGSALKKRGFHPLYVPDNSFVDKRLSGHADLSVFYAGGAAVFLAPYLKNTVFSQNLSDIGLEPVFLDIIQGERYPNDAQMNICVLGKHFIYCPGVSYLPLVENLIRKGLTPIAVKQGYVKCCVCPTGEGSLITSDPGIEKCCLQHGLEVLKIQPGSIALEGFSYGFIGGSAFIVDGKTIAFTGSIDRHPDAGKIYGHLEKHNLKPLFLSDRPIFDIGSFILIN